jgi:hypothetical protein
MKNFPDKTLPLLKTKIMNDKKNRAVPENPSQYDLPFKEKNIEKKNDEDEIESDGSASAFEETENVNEDNFDNLSEK